MRATLLALLLTVVAAWADEPVLRVIDLKSSSAIPAKLEHRKTADKQWYPAFVGTTGALHDHFKTSPETVAALEFFIGGRVGVNKDTEIEVITDRSVTGRGESLRRIVLINGALWMKSNKLKEPLEIETNGGVMGIRGTEFTLESNSDVTNLSVLEGSVEVKDAQKKLLGMAEAGDVYQVSLSRPPIKEHYDPEVLRRKLEQSSLGEAIQLVKQEVQDVRIAINEEERRLAILLGMIDDLSHGIRLAPPYQRAITQKVTADGAQGLQPSGSLSALNAFHWQPFPQADGYAIFLSAKKDFQSILFSERTRDAQALYPSSARPLEPGSYYWRVIPLDSSDQPISGATQANFIINRP